MPEDAGAFALAVAAWLIGNGVGWFVQSTATSLRYNGRWKDVPPWKKRSLAATGSIAAAVAGAWVLQDPPPIPTQQLVFRLWLVQVIAAWAGATLLDVAAERLKSGGGQ